MGSLESFCVQTVNKMVGSGMEGVGGRKFRQDRTQKSAERLYYREVFRGDVVVECPILKALELTTKELMKWKAVGKKVTSIDKA